MSSSKQMTLTQACKPPLSSPLKVEVLLAAYSHTGRPNFHRPNLQADKFRYLFSNLMHAS